jgi:hypothetical protein
MTGISSSSRPAAWLLALAGTGCGLVGFDAADGRRGIDGPDPLRADAAVDGSALLDVDGDGVVDSVDNCPAVGNPDQANEDGDGAGDECDLCPPHAAGGNADADGDEVGDACDPLPLVAGDTLVAFFGFSSTVAPPGLTLVGSWTFMGGQAHGRAPLDELAAATVEIMGQAETVSTDVTIDALHGDLVARPVGLVHRFSAASSDGVICVFGINPFNSQVYAIADNRTTTALASQPGVATVGTRTDLRSNRADTLYQCDSPALTSALGASSTLPTAPNRVGLFTRSADASFNWLMVVTSPLTAAR